MGDSLQSVLDGKDWEHMELRGESAAFGGMPATAGYGFNDTGELTGGYYILNAGAGNETALTQADYLTELYGPPDDSQTPGEPKLISWSDVAGQPKAGTLGPNVYTYTNGMVVVTFSAIADGQN